MIEAVEYMEDITGSFQAAKNRLEELAKLPDYLGGRPIQWHDESLAAAIQPSWTVQAYFKDKGDITAKDCLPAGCRLVEIPEFMAHLLGIGVVKNIVKRDSQGSVTEVVEEE